MGFSWIAVDALTGRPWADLPDFRIDAVSIILGQTQTAIGSYPVTESVLPPTSPIYPGTISPGTSLFPGGGGVRRLATATPVDWLQGTVPWGVAILLLADGVPNPVAGWYINQRVRDQGDAMSIPLVTAEGYFDRRYVGNYSPVLVDQNTIASTIVASYAAAAPAGSVGLSGLPFTTAVIGGAGTARTRTYLDQNDQTLTTALSELMGVNGGPEWTVTWQHLTSPERYVPVFNVGSRIGTPVAAGFMPAATFEMGGTSNGGSVTKATYTEDYSTGKGANFVTATGTVDATTGLRPQQSQSYADVRRPAIEYRWNPSTSITDTATLLAHAVATLPLMQNGSRALTLESVGVSGPQVGVDFGLGDTVGYSIGGVDLNGAETVPEFPGGLTGQARVIGYLMHPDDATPVVTPILGGV